MKLNFLGILILVIVVGAGVGVAYGAGVVMGKGSAPAATQAQSTSEAAGASGTPGAFMAGGNARGGAGGGGTFGTVQAVNGNTLTVSTQSGGAVQVTLTDSTSIRKTADGTKDDLKQGVEIMVTGQQGTGGNVTATSIQIVPASEAAPSQMPRAKPQGTSASKP
ncbi:MAG: DUF5666 domain-containing protein [Dehalococcoidia bacterium]|nr:DUF5666 domain-containing protein [Dehalococcoidia bacterium]